MADHSQMKLGKRPTRHDPRTLRLERYLLPELPPPPATCAWSLMQPAGWGMMLNGPDPANPPQIPFGVGDCTKAGIAHAIQTWTEVINQRITISDTAILTYYELWDGYVLGDEATDNGAVELDTLNRWRKEGFAGHELLAYAAVPVGDFQKVKQAIALFGGAYIGVGLPITARDQDTWDVVSGGGSAAQKDSWGGHCVWVLAYDEETLTCVTWGELKKMTWNFWAQYVDEAYALLSPDFITLRGIAPSGFDLDALKTDLGLVT